jgi:6-phosphofructokinase 1
VYLESLVRSQFHCKVRSIQLNVLQRAAYHLCSAADLREAYEIGSEAVKFAMEGKTRVMAVIKRLSDQPYLISYDCVKVDRVANGERKVPREWISADGHDVTQGMIDYLRPLVAGKAEEFLSNGIPVYFNFHKAVPGC